MTHITIRENSSHYSHLIENLNRLNISITNQSEIITTDIEGRFSEIGNLYKSVDLINEAFHEISAQSEELTATGDFLKQLAGILNSLVRNFRVEQNVSQELITS